DDLAWRDRKGYIVERKRPRSALRWRFVREAHVAELYERHSSPILREARGRGVGAREGSFDHAARVRCSAAAGLHPGARRPRLPRRERVSSTPPSPPPTARASSLAFDTIALSGATGLMPCASSYGASALGSEVGAVAGAEEVDEKRGAAEGGDHAD